MHVSALAYDLKQRTTTAVGTVPDKSDGRESSKKMTIIGQQSNSNITFKPAHFCNLERMRGPCGHEGRLLSVQKDAAVLHHDCYCVVSQDAPHLLLRSIMSMSLNTQNECLANFAQRVDAMLRKSKIHVADKSLTIQWLSGMDRLRATNLNTLDVMNDDHADADHSEYNSESDADEHENVDEGDSECGTDDRTDSNDHNVEVGLDGPKNARSMDPAPTLLTKSREEQHATTSVLDTSAGESASTEPTPSLPNDWIARRTPEVRPGTVLVLATLSEDASRSIIMPLSRFKRSFFLFVYNLSEQAFWVACHYTIPPSSHEDDLDVRKAPDR